VATPPVEPGGARVSPTLAVELIAPVVRALAHAHAQGLVRRTCCGVATRRFTPDGTRIVVGSWRPAETRLWNADGSGQPIISRNVDALPSFTPDVRGSWPKPQTGRSACQERVAAARASRH